MTKVVFEKKGAIFNSFRVTGHTGYEESGKDIVCSAVSSLTIHTVNLICDDLKCDATVDNDDGYIYLSLNEKNEFAELLIKALEKSLRDVSKQYPRFLKVEVKV